jgi:hypothetical protein
VPRRKAAVEGITKQLHFLITWENIKATVTTMHNFSVDRVY